MLLCKNTDDMSKHKIQLGPIAFDFHLSSIKFLKDTLHTIDMVSELTSTLLRNHEKQITTKIMHTCSSLLIVRVSTVIFGYCVVYHKLHPSKSNMSDLLLKIKEKPTTRVKIAVVT